MKRIVILATAMLLSSQAFASSVIAEKAVTANGYTVRLQLLDEKVEGALRNIVKCEFGSNLARMSTEVAGAPQSSKLSSMGCWVVSRDGTIEYSALDRTTGKFLYVKTSADQYQTYSAFKTWGDYMGAFMLSDTQ